MSFWPEGATLLLAGRQQQDMSVVDRSEVERGPAKTRRNATDPMITQSGTLLFKSRSAVAAFRAWLYSAAGANAGAGWFDWTDPRTGTLRSIRFVTLGALTPLAGMFAVAQQAVTFEYLETVETIASLAPRRWDFVSDTQGWISYGGFNPVTWSGGRLIVGANPTQFPIVVSTPDLQLPGRLYYRIRASVQRLSGTGWYGIAYYGNYVHNESSDFRKDSPNVIPAVGQSAILEWDMSTLSAGGADWLLSTIDHLRLDLGSSDQDSFAIDWVEVVAP